MIINHVNDMIQNKCQVLNSFGKDQTGLISYKFNDQGFRGNKDYNFIPEYAFFGCSIVFGIGVPIEDTFSYKFNNSQNYGLASRYDNRDVMTIVDKFVSSPLYSPLVKIVVVWHSRDSSNLDTYYKNLKHFNIFHFYCGDPLPYERCFPVIKNLDYDVSGTHCGPKTHNFYYRVFKSLFLNQ
jgi:hypothetical protein